MRQDFMRVVPVYLVAVLVLLSGCAGVESEKPLSSPQSAVPDHRLEGMWRSGHGDSIGYLYIAYRSKGIGSLMIVGKNGDGSLLNLKWDFFVTRTAKHTYMNLYNMDAGSSEEVDEFLSGHTKAYVFARYDFNWLGRMVWEFETSDGYSKAVKSGRLKGKIEPIDSNNSNVFLKDSSEHILEFIESSKPGDVFLAPQTFTKVGGP